MSVKFRAKKDDITSRLRHLILGSETSSLNALLKMVILPQYIKAQMLRWQTKNVHKWFTGGEWKKLNPAYEKYKKRRFMAFPGKGTKMLVAEGRLLSATLLQNRNYSRSDIREGKLFVSTTLDYAEHVDKVRTITAFSQDFQDDLRDRVKRYFTLKYARGKTR